MCIRTFAIAVCLLLPALANAQGEHPDTFHAFTLEADIGEAKEETVATWDLDGWAGGDFNKLAIKSEGEVVDSDTHEAELWALYSRNIAEFWDAQVGLRQDFEPQSTTYIAAGFAGLAPYLFETDLHLFVSDEGDFSGRLHQENELLITQRLILAPSLELNFFGQDVEEQEVAAGFSSLELALQSRYEFTRRFAPYVELRYERLLGQTATWAEDAGERRDDFVVALGMVVKF